MCNTTTNRTLKVWHQYLAVLVPVVLLLVLSLLISKPARAAEAVPQLGAMEPVTGTLTPQPTPGITSENDRRIIIGDQVISGRDFTLDSDETLRGDLTVFGGNVRLAEGSRVEGNVSVFGGNADLYGTVTRHLTVFGGTVHLRSSARIEGGESVVGGSIQRDPGAVELGLGTRYPSLPFSANLPFDQRGILRTLFDAISNAFGRVMSLLLIVLLAIAVVALFPTNAARIAQTVQHDWLVSGSVGILTYVALPIIIIIMAITICLIPAAILVAIAWALASLFGWAVIACMTGERLAMGFNQRNWTRVGQTALGAVVLGLVGMIPLVGWMIGLLASALGLGALLLTRVGTQSYPSRSTPVTSTQLPTTPIS